MKRLYWLVLKSFIGPFILIFFIVLFILLMQFLWRYIDDLIGKGLSFSVIAELLLYTTASLVPMALPLAILMASLMTFGNMGEFNELTAIKASGISLQRIMMPLVVLVTFISIGAFFFANEIMPYTNLKMRSLLYDVRNQRPEIQILPGTFYNGIDGYSLRAERKDPSTNVLYDIKIYDHTQHKGNVSVMIADSGKMIITEDERSMIFTLYNGYAYNELEDEKITRRRKTYPHRFDRFREQKIVIELSGFGLIRTDESLFRNHYAMLDLSQLTAIGDSVEVEIAGKQDVMINTLIGSNYFRKRSHGTVRTAQEPPDIRHPSEAELPGKKGPMKKQGYSSGPPEIPMPMPEEIIEKPVEEEIVLHSSGTYNQDTTSYLDLFKQLTLKEKDVVLGSAVSYARSARTYVVSSATTIDIKTKTLRKFEIEKQRKFTLSFACFIFLIIGAPLGAIIRKGGFGLPLVLSTLLFIFYYVISLIGEKVVHESILPHYQGMWIASAVFLITGAFLTYKAATDAAMLNLETYSNILRKYLGIKRTNLLYRIEKEAIKTAPRQAKHDNLIASLSSFRDMIEESRSDVDEHLKISRFLVSLAGFHESSNIVLFERLYKNIISGIYHSDLRNDKTILSKLDEFPNFDYVNYLDLKWRLYVRFVLLLIPPITLLIMLRHYIQLLNLNSKLKNIDQLTGDLIVLLQKHDIFES